ncbi:WXG100 family type VII secretion target [Streptomyces noursei]|uniref:WXG100 family type VII secretion target n=1 Tax=Streptomyces noursei TaxID=1971 RepID=UPI001962D3DD|nr:WXG100 family type VII secretion target [Streptomyces noursei]QRX91148.1 WXG100 family type VII secretion target [Streptomyces noursei]
MINGSLRAAPLARRESIDMKGDHVMAWGTTPNPPNSGGSDATQINSPAKLRQAGNNSRELAGELNSKGRTAKEETVHAAAGLKGASWDGRLGTAMEQAAKTWDDQVAQLVRTLREIHAKCTTTAANYERSEQENAAKFKSQPKTTPFG